MASPRGAFLVVYEGDRAVGCGRIETLDEGLGEIERMFVRPSARGRGHARRLLAAIEQAGRELGHRRFVLDTAAPLVEAKRLHLAAGYRRVVPYDDNPYAAAWFAKGADVP